MGIKEDELSKLFQFFGKLQSTNNINKGGMGLGLTISKMIVQEMNGDIDVVSTYGSGTKFTFKFELQGPVNKQVFTYDSAPPFDRLAVP